MNLYEYQRSRSFVGLRPRSLRCNIFKLLMLRNCQADWSQISYGASMGCGEWNLFKCFRSHTMLIHVYGEKLQKSSLERRGRWPWNLVYGIGYYQCFHMMTLRWPWPFLWQGQICFRMLLHGWKLIQHRVLMYFQVCSNSAYPQHTGPMVLWLH